MSGDLLSGKVALITGAAAGIGEASALLFARRGATVVVSDVDEEGGERTAEKIRVAGGSAVFFRADVSRADDVKALVAATVARFDRLDCAFNNAGIGGDNGPTGACTEDNWNRVIAVDLTGVFLCMKYEIRAMLTQDRPGGAIVNTASVAGLVGLDLGMPAYVAAKHGVVGLTRAAALEYATRRVRVNAVCPGGIRTASFEADVASKLVTEEGIARMHPVNRMGETREIAEAAAWLCSDASSFMTGQAMAVDGGMTAR